MNEKLYEALEVCLDALESGVNPESVVKLYPEMESELLPLLETAKQARLLAMQDVPDAALRRGKARLLQHAAGMREVSARQRRKRAIFSFPRLATSLAIALLIFFSGTELVRASNGALPGDNLYPVKRTWEDVRLLLVVNPESREELESEFEQERIQEIDDLLSEGRHESIAFAGVVTEQTGDLWVVSGVTVQITSESRLPAIPVTVGTSVKLQGRTNVLGFVEADYVEILGWNIVLPTSVPTQIETQEENKTSGSESSSGEDMNEQGDDELKSESSSDDGSELREPEDSHDDSSDTSNIGSDKNDSDNDTSNTKDKSDNSGKSGGEDDQSGNENESDD